MTRNRTGVLALTASAVVIFGLPAGSLGGAQLRDTRSSLQQTGQQVQSGLKSTVQKTGERTTAAVDRTKATLRQRTAAAKTRVTATDPPRQPPLHGTNPHGQGTVGIVDVDPSAERPLGPSTDGSDSGEEAVIGRARGEQTANGSFRGRITIAALFGRELAGVQSTPGQTSNGPLQSLQTGVLDPLCQSTNQQVCISLLRADSTTTATGSTNDFAVARASIIGLNVGAAESAGNISQDANCQTSVGSARTANVATSGGTIAAAANSSSTSRSCRGQAPQVANTSQVINLGGTGVGLPAPGCANGTPDTTAGIPGLLPIICNADEIAGAAAVREALSVYALQVGTNALAREATAASESFSVAPPESGTQCTDGVDNDNDGTIDSRDPGCHTDGNPNNPASFDPTDNDERNGGNTGSGGGGGARNLNAGSLPFTGTDILGLALAGLLALAGGLVLRRREDVRTVR
jgi:hypothetical protein